MHHPTVFLTLTSMILCLLLIASAESSDLQPPCVILAWDDTGNFGPATPGTKTAGWQEAINYCVAHAQDLHVKGGWGGRKPVYNVSETIVLPPTQDFKIDGGVYVLNWTGPADDPSKDLMRIDSAMNTEYHFGILVYGGAGAAMRIRPENPVPIDGFSVFTECLIVSQGMADPAPFTRGERKHGVGLALDGSKGSIVANRFDFIGGILNFKTCIDISGDFTQNRFACLHLHTNADNSTLLQAGPGTTQNIFDFTIGVDQGAQGVQGLVISGRNNVFQVVTRDGFAPASDIVLEETARGNRIDILHGRDAFRPEDFVTDHAAKGANSITGTGTQAK